MNTEQEKRLASLKEAIKEYERFRTLSEKEKEMLYSQCKNGTFMDLSYDWSFKHLMQDKDILLMLLNDILPEQVAAVEHLPNEVDRFFAGDKDATMDVLCKSADGTREFVVEIQKQSQSYYLDRMLYYGASMLHAQLGSGGDYDALVPVYVICLMDFSLWHSQDRLIYRYSLIEEDLHDRYGEHVPIPEKNRNAGDLIHIYLLELPRLKKKSMEGMNPLEGWLYLLKNLHKFAASPDGMDPRFGRVVDAARLMHLPEGEQLQYYRAMLSESEKKAYYGGGYQQGVMKGHDEGFAEGQQSGREDASIEIARRMREAGADAAYIKAMTGIAISD